MAEELLDGVQLWEEINRAALSCRNGQRRCAVSYVTAADRLPLGRNDVLVVNAGKNAMRQGATSKRALRHYVERGVKVFSVAELHTKIYVLGNRVVVGSANLSERASTGMSLEAAVVTSSKHIRRQAIGFIDDLIARRQPMCLADVDALPDCLVPRRRVLPASEIVDVPERLWAFWWGEMPLTADEERLVRSAGRGTANELLVVPAGDPAQPGELLLPVGRPKFDKIFGPPQRVLERRSDGKSHVLVVRALDGFEDLGVGPEHQRRRARLPHSIRDLGAADGDIEFTGPALEGLLNLFRS